MHSCSDVDLGIQKKDHLNMAGTLSLANSSYMHLDKVCLKYTKFDWAMMSNEYTAESVG